METRNFAYLALVALITVSTTLIAQVPLRIHYQGNLAAPSGNPIDRSVNMQFKLYSAATAGTSLWEETQSSVSVKKGLFNVLLGSRTAFPKDIFSDPKYLEIVIGGEILAPRQQIGSVPYAISSSIALGQVALSSNLSDIKQHSIQGDQATTYTLVNEAGPIVLLSGAVHGRIASYTVKITVDGVTATTLTPAVYEDSADDENAFVQLPPIMASLNLKIEIIQTTSTYSIAGYAWTKKL